MFYRVIGLILGLFLSALQADISMSHGWKIPQTPLYVGGYLSAQYDAQEKHQASFDDVALLFYGDFDMFHLLGEVEASDIALDSLDIDAKDLHIERLQLEYEVSDNAFIRVGKFNSDVGFWNQTPVDALDDTSTSPDILRRVFPKLTTGVLYHHDMFQDDASFSLTLQHNQNIDKDYNNIVVDRHYALAYQRYEGLFSWRGNVGYFKEDGIGDAYYMGVGAQMLGDEWTVLGEVFRKNQEHHDIPYDAYLQATWHVLYGQDIVFRTQQYKDVSLAVSENISLLGYTYRPWASLALKGAYIRHSSLDKSRFVFSLSVIF